MRGLPGSPYACVTVALQVQDGQIAVLWLYRQLTEEDKDELLHEPLACYPAPFPRESLTLVDAGRRAPNQLHVVNDMSILMM